MGPFWAGWRQVGCSFALLACSGAVAASYGTIAGPLGSAFHPSRMVLMLAMTVMSGVAGLLSPFLGSLMDRTSMRKVMVAGSLLLSLGYAALSLITTFVHALLIFGLLIAPATVLIGPVAATVLLSRWFTRRRGAAIGLAIAGVAMGTIVFPPILQGLFNHFDWRVAFQLAGLLVFLVTMPAALLVINSPADRGLFPDGAKAPPETRVATLPLVSVREILTDPAFWIATCIFVAVISGMKGTVTNLSPMAIDVGIKPIDAALLVSIYGAMALVSKLSFAAVADHVSTRLLLFISLGGFAAGMACLANASLGFWMIAAGVSFVGLAGGITTPMQSYLIPRIFGPHCVGRAYGLMSTVMFLFLLSTPPLFGRIFDVTGSYSAIYLTFIALTACSMLAVPFLRLHPRNEV